MILYRTGREADEKEEYFILFTNKILQTIWPNNKQTTIALQNKRESGVK